MVGGPVVVAGGPTMAGFCGSTSTRTLAELAHETVMANKKRWMVALSALLVTKTGLAILGCDSFKR